jgi:hypothetical protein
MRFQTIIALFLSTLAIAAPVDLAARDAEADAAPVPAAEAKPQYGSYGDYPPPAGGYGSYGDYAAPPPPPPTNPYGSYADYGTYKKN